MARRGYRQQGSDQAVRLVFRPGLGFEEMKLLTQGAITLAVLMMIGLLLTGAGRDHTPIWFAVAFGLAAFGVMVSTVKHAYEIVIGPHEMILRSREFPWVWDEQRLPRGAIQRLERRSQGPRVRLELELRDGTRVLVFQGLDLDPETAEKMSQTIERALDPEQIEELADEHRDKPRSGEG